MSKWQHVLTSLLTSCVLQVLGQTVQDEFIAPSAPDKSANLTNGQHYEIRWKPELRNFFSTYAPSVDPDNASLWVIGTYQAQFKHLVSPFVDIDTGMVDWTIDIPSNELAETPYWGFSFLDQNGTYSGANGQQISSPMFIVTDKESDTGGAGVVEVATSSTSSVTTPGPTSSGAAATVVTATSSTSIRATSPNVRTTSSTTPSSTSISTGLAQVTSTSVAAMTATVTSQNGMPTGTSVPAPQPHAPLTAGAVAGIAVALLVMIVLIVSVVVLAVCLCRRRRRRTKPEDSTPRLGEVRYIDSRGEEGLHVRGDRGHTPPPYGSPTDVYHAHYADSTGKAEMDGLGTFEAEAVVPVEADSGARVELAGDQHHQSKWQEWRRSRQ